MTASQLMSPYEALSLFISILALILSTWVFIKNHRFSKAAMEINLRNMVIHASEAMNDALQDATAFEDANDSFAQTFKEGYQSFLINYLKAYDDACRSFFAHDVRKKHFIESYSNEIKGLFEDQPFKNILAVNDQFPNLKKFYRKHLQ